MIKQADENDILVIEDILLDTVIWMKKNQMENNWNEDNIKWDSLKKDYKIDEFYIDYEDGVPAGCMALTDLDTKYWPEIEKGKSLYLHKLAVKRELKGEGISKKLIDFAKELAIKNNINLVRLDCNFKKDRLRKFYESHGFTYRYAKSGMALYTWKPVA